MRTQLFVAISVTTAAMTCSPLALARPQAVMLTTYLRAGPGERFAVLDEIEAHKQVDVQDCSADWCRVVSDGAPGFVKQDAFSAPDIHRVPPGIPASAECVTARLNGRPSEGDEVRVCGK